MAVTDIGTFITSSPEIREGRPRIAGTGVTVHRIAVWYKLGNDPEEIVRQIPHLTIAQVFAALTYYYGNQAQLDYATEQGRVLCSFSIADFDRLHVEYMVQGKSHAGIILVQQQRYTLGEQMRRMLKIIAAKPAETMENHIEFLSAWG